MCHRGRGDEHHQQRAASAIHLPGLRVGSPGWIKASRLQPLIPRHTERWASLYRGRAAVEREFGYLKHHHGLPVLRVRGLDRVRLHADLTILVRLALSLARARAIPLAA